MLQSVKTEVHSTSKKFLEIIFFLNKKKITSKFAAPQVTHKSVQIALKLVYLVQILRLRLFHLKHLATPIVIL